jgi:hypothetical protein
MHVWTCYIISIPSGGLVANHNRNQCIISTLGWWKFTVNNRQQTAPGIGSTQAIWSRHVSSASKSPDCIIAHWSDWCTSPVRPVWCCCTSVFNLGFVDQPRNLVVFWWTTGNPANSVYPPPITTLDVAHTKSRLNLGFEAQSRNHPLLHLTILATMQPALDSASHQVSRTKPTYLLHTWRPHRPRPFAVVLHLHQHQSSRNLHL